jgi:hypothetical protein
VIRKREKEEERRQLEESLKTIAKLRSREVPTSSYTLPLQYPYSEADIEELKKRTEEREAKLKVQRKKKEEEFEQYRLLENELADRIAKLPIVPPYHALLDDPDPNAPRAPRIEGVNYRCIRPVIDSPSVPTGHQEAAVYLGCRPKEKRKGQTVDRSEQPIQTEPLDLSRQVANDLLEEEPPLQRHVVEIEEDELQILWHEELPVKAASVKSRLGPKVPQ